MREPLTQALAPLAPKPLWANGQGVCELLSWDTEFWGFPIARVHGNSLTVAQVKAVDRWCREQSIRCLYFLSRADDPTTTRVAEDGGFRLVDIRVTLDRKGSAERPCVSGRVAHLETIRSANPDDLPALRLIARENYHFTRFYFDRNFPRQLCPLLYETWIRRSCDGYADRVLVTELDGKPVGFISCHIDHEGAESRGRIGLVGLAQSAQGRGIGRELVGKACEWFFANGASEITVVTQGRNGAAQRLYQYCGFVTRATELWYHKWYP